MTSSLAESNKILPEAVLNLRDRLKHGQNVAKILESQIDTAQQNISLLQGQVRLATETILNLKKHFQDTENILEQLISPEQSGRLEIELKDLDNEPSTPKHASVANNVDSTTRSPVPSDTTNEATNSFDDKRIEQNKSPYAQQLRQVLDVLTDEDVSRDNPRGSKMMTPLMQHHKHDVCSSKECSCSDCNSPPHMSSGSSRHGYSNKCDCGSSSCTGGMDHFHHKQRSGEEHCRNPSNNMKHKQINHSHHINMSPKSFERKDSSSHSRSPSSHSNHSYSNHCNAPCCTNNEPSEYARPVHYVSIHSPPMRTNENVAPPSNKHMVERHHHSPHCVGDKCQCLPYVSYVPYGSRSYHVIDSPQGGMPPEMHTMSPSSSSRKRQYVPLMPGEEPPHLKYTKVKRIDGNKLTAQKVLQDFTKRRFFAYNPQFDLDLLIVPPPIPAMDLLKSNFVQKQSQEISHKPPKSVQASTQDSFTKFNPYKQENDRNSEHTDERVVRCDTPRYPDSKSGHGFSYEESERSENTPDSKEMKRNLKETRNGSMYENGNNVQEKRNDNSPVESDDHRSNNPLNPLSHVTVNMSSNNNIYSTSMYKSPNSKLKFLPPIKEELMESKVNNEVVTIEPRSKLEDHINKLRNENNAKLCQSPVGGNDNNNNNNGSPFNKSNHFNDQEFWNKEIKRSAHMLNNNTPCS